MTEHEDASGLDLARGMKRCPFCAEGIWEEAVKCRYCGEMVGTTSPFKEVTILDTKPALRGYGRELCLGILLLPLVGVGLIFFVMIFLDRTGKRYKITNQRIIVQRGLLSKNIDEIKIKDIRNINTRQNGLSRLMGIGDVLIGTAATSGNEILIKGIKRPVRFKELVMSQKI